MDALTTGADVATMATGLAAVTAAVAWVRRQWDGWQADRRERQRRNWHGYIDVGGIDTWYVRLAEPPKPDGPLVTLEFTSRDGTPDLNVAQSARTVIQRDGILSRAPTTGELEFLKYLRIRDGYDQRNEAIR